jgi:hypothetical protein
VTICSLQIGQISRSLAFAAATLFVSGRDTFDAKSVVFASDASCAVDPDSELLVSEAELSEDGGRVVVLLAVVIGLGMGGLTGEPRMRPRPRTRPVLMVVVDWLLST